jgi:1-acyl-sn-glycerol-3-phosphate acyltransferase
MILFKFFYTVIVHLVWYCAFFFHFFVAALCLLFVKDKPGFHYWLATKFAQFGCFITGMRLTVYGLENVPKDRNYLLLSNHKSLLDVTSYFAASPRRLSFFAKKELLKVPILGWDIKMQEHFIVDRQNARQGVKQLQELSDALREGRSILIFPEGTRSTTDEILPFKRGAFKMAANTGTTILPAYIHGSDVLVPKTSLLTQPGNYSISFGQPIEVPEVTDSAQQRELVKRVMEETRARILQLKAERRQKDA